MKTATLAIDLNSGAGYLRLRSLPVVRTVVKREWPLLAVDYAAKGAVVGVEITGEAEIDMAKLLKLAGVLNAEQFAQTYRFKVVTQRAELQPA